MEQAIVKLTPEEITQLANPNNVSLGGLLFAPKRVRFVAVRDSLQRSAQLRDASTYRNHGLVINHDHPLTDGLVGYGVIGQLPEWK